jgi:hypothetical protein
MLTYARQERGREEAEIAFVRGEFDSKSLKLRQRQARYERITMPYAHVCSRMLTYDDVC